MLFWGQIHELSVYSERQEIQFHWKYIWSEKARAPTNEQAQNSAGWYQLWTVYMWMCRWRGSQLKKLKEKSGLEFRYVNHFRLQCFYLFRVHCQAIGCKSCGKFHFSQIERKRELWACFSSEVCIALYWNIESVRVAYITIHFFNCIKTVKSLCMPMLCLVLSVAHSLIRPLLSSLSTAPSISPSFFLIFTQSLERSSNSPYLAVVFFALTVIHSLSVLPMIG